MRKSIDHVRLDPTNILLATSTLITSTIVTIYKYKYKKFSIVVVVSQTCGNWNVSVTFAYLVC